MIFFSHSKQTKRGFSLYIHSWNPSAKKYILTCSVCGHKGYSPVILDPGFCDANAHIFVLLEHRAIHRELTKILEPLNLDELGRCRVCAKIHNRV